MEIGLKLISTNAEIKKMILDALVAELDRPLRISLPHIKARIKELVTIKIQSSDTFKSLVGGRLQGELGVPDVYKKLSDVLDIWINTIDVTYVAPRVVSNHIEGSITVSAVNDDFRDVLSLTAASYTTEKGQIIPWLSWLIEAGHQFLIRDYTVTFDTKNLPNSRTGLALMRVAPNGAWRVPKEHAGTLDNNFITRALRESHDRVADIIQKEIESKI